MTTKAEKQLESAKTRAKNLAKRLAGGIKGTAFAGGAGVGLSYAVPAIQDAVETLQDNLYMGLALVAGGHVLKSKQLEAGAAVVGVGGYLIGQYLQEESSDSNNASAQQTSTAGLMVPDTAGWSMLESQPDAGSVPSNAPSGRGGSIQSAPQPVEVRQLVQDTRVRAGSVAEAAALMD